MITLKALYILSILYIGPQFGAVEHTYEFNSRVECTNVRDEIVSELETQAAIIWTVTEDCNQVI